MYNAAHSLFYSNVLYYTPHRVILKHNAECLIVSWLFLGPVLHMEVPNVRTCNRCVVEGLLGSIQSP